MKDFIEIDGIKFYYNPVELFHGRKIIDKNISEENLRILIDVLSNTNITYGIMFGTLLGAIRNGDFIDHDEDVDIYVLEEFKRDFLRLLPELNSRGLILVRAIEGEISVMRENEYIDISFLRKKKNFWFQDVRTLNDNFTYPAYNLEQTQEFLFRNISLPIPSKPEVLLAKIYGKNWQRPISGDHARPNTFLAWIKKWYYFFKNLTPLKR